MQDITQSPKDWLIVLGFAALMLLVCFGMLVAIYQRREIDRKKIEKSLAQYGWRLLAAERQTDFFSRRGSPRRYLVTYQTDKGDTIQAECTMSWWSGIRWISSTPFGA